MRGVARMSASTSSGWSISRPMPWQLHDRRLDAASTRRGKVRQEAVVAETQRHHQGRRAQHRVRAALVARGNDSERWRRSARRDDRGYFRCRDARNITGHGQHCFPALCRKDTRHGGDRAGVAVACAVRHDAGAVASSQFRRERIERVDHDSRQRCLGECRKHVLQHRRSQRLTLLRCKQWGQALLGAGEFLHRHRRPDFRCHRSRRSTRAAPRTMRASASRSARVLISVCPSVTLALMPAT